MRKLFKLFNSIRKKDSGQGLVEYGLILALVSIVAIATLGGLGGRIKGGFEKVADSFGFVEVVEKHTVTFIDFDGEVLDSVEVVDGGSALAPEAPVVEGYTFIGWEGEFTDVSEDVTISSKYERNSYTITFMDAAGKELGVVSVSHGDQATAPNIPNVTEDMWEQPLDNIQSDGVITLSYAIIETADDLNNVRNKMDGKYIQVANINLSKFTNFEPIGTDSSEFTGTFDGGGYVISNLTISRGSEDYVGLFGWVEGATLKNIGLANVNVTGGNETGGLVGYQSRLSTVTNSYATGSVTGGDDTGGLIGYQSRSSVSDSYATVTVTGEDWTGGLVGQQYDSSTVSNSYATGSVNGASYTGGLVGNQSDSSTVGNSYSTGSVNGTGDHVGGLIGYQSGSSTVSNSYATGTVTGRSRIAGLVGNQVDSSVSNSYATGSVTGSSWTGGLVAEQWASSTTNSYWDANTTKQEESEGGTGKTTSEMKNKNTYTGWDNTIWEIKDGQYPTLR